MSEGQRSRIRPSDQPAPTVSYGKRGPISGAFLEGMETPPTSDNEQLSLLSISSVVASPARITALQESAAAWLATVALSGGECTGSLLSAAPHGLSGKMYLGSCPATEDVTSLRSLPALLNSGMASPGLLLTLNTSEWRNDGDACSLSDILEESPSPKYLLSARACTGILRRAKKRGKKLPPALAHALQAGTTREARWRLSRLTTAPVRH